MRFTRWLVASCSLLLLAAPAFALQPPGGQDQFVPVSQLPPSEHLAAAPLLIAAYAFVWVALIVYLWSIWRRIEKVEADLRALQRRSTERSSAR